VPAPTNATSSVAALLVLIAAATDLTTPAAADLAASSGTCAEALPSLWVPRRSSASPDLLVRCPEQSGTIAGS
jgi:hypothetical protein